MNKETNKWIEEKLEKIENIIENTCTGFESDGDGDERNVYGISDTALDVIKDYFRKALQEAVAREKKEIVKIIIDGQEVGGERKDIIDKINNLNT